MGNFLIGEGNSIIFAQILLGVLTTCGFSLQIWLGMLRRKWDNHDRANQAKAIANRAEEVAQLAIKVVEDLAAQTAKRTKVLQSELANNTAITVAAKERAEVAYIEANNVNMKIAKLAEVASATNVIQLAKGVVDDVKIDHIQSTTDETLVRVKG